MVARLGEMLTMKRRSFEVFEVLDEILQSLTEWSLIAIIIFVVVLIVMRIA